MLLESLKDLSHVDMLAHEDPILMLLYLHSQEIAECAHNNLEIMMQLINKHIDITFITARSQAVIHINGDIYVGTQINLCLLY